MSALKPCPFCGWQPPEDDLDDVLYPDGTWWTFALTANPDAPRRKRYHHHLARPPGANQCWAMHCTENMGGCGAEIHGDTEAEVRQKWNRRTEPTAAPSGQKAAQPHEGE